MSIWYLFNKQKEEMELFVEFDIFSIYEHKLRGKSFTKNFSLACCSPAAEIQMKNMGVFFYDTKGTFGNISEEHQKACLTMVPTQYSPPNKE